MRSESLDQDETVDETMHMQKRSNYYLSSSLGTLEKIIIFSLFITHTYSDGPVNN